MKVTAKQFESMTATLATDIQTVKDHYNLYWNLQQAVSEYEIAFNQTRAFWSLTLNANWQTALHTLCRVYDKTGPAFGLKEWLKAAKDSKFLFQKSLTDQEVLADIETVKDSDPLVAKLLRLRNKVVAHNDYQGILNSIEWTKQYPLKYEEFKKLIDRAFLLLNKYSSLYSKSRYGGLIGDDDYKWVLQTLKDKLNHYCPVKNRQKSHKRLI